TPGLRDPATRSGSRPRPATAPGTHAASRPGSPTRPAGAGIPDRHQPRTRSDQASAPALPAPAAASWEHLLPPATDRAGSPAAPESATASVMASEKESVLASVSVLPMASLLAF